MFAWLAGFSPAPLLVEAAPVAAFRELSVAWSWLAVTAVEEPTAI